MKISTTFIAKDLKAELKDAGVKVLRCKQYRGNALVTIVNTIENKDLFENYTKNNNYAGPCNADLCSRPTSQKYIDYGNVIKYITVG